MKVFVFLTKQECKYCLGLLREDDKLDGLKVFQGHSATEIRGMINSIECECIFVGKNIRTQVLAPMLRELTYMRTDLPEKLKFHWVPPYKLPIDDVAWLYDYGVFTEETEKLSTFQIASSLGISYGMKNEIQTLAMVYFSLVGDFDRINI